MSKQRVLRTPIERQIDALQQERIQAIRRGDVPLYRYPIIHEMPRSSHGGGDDHAFAAGPLWPPAPESMRTEWSPEQVKAGDSR